MLSVSKYVFNFDDDLVVKNLFHKLRFEPTLQAVFACSLAELLYRRK